MASDFSSRIYAMVALFLSLTLGVSSGAAPKKAAPKAAQKAAPVQIPMTPSKKRFIQIQEQFDLAKQQVKAGKLPQALAVLDQLNASFGKTEAQLQEIVEQKAAATAPVHHDLAAQSQWLHARRELTDVRVDRRAVELLKSNLQLATGELNETQWVERYQKAIASDPTTAEDFSERVLALSQEDFTAERLFRLLRSELPPKAGAAVAIELLTYRPGEKASIEDYSRFYQEVIARTIGVPVVADGLLVEYIKELDRRKASDVADRVLEGFIAAAPDSELACRAAGMRLGALEGQERDRMVQALWETYPNTRLSRVLHVAYAQALARQKHFLEAAVILDTKGQLPKVHSGQELAAQLVQLFIPRSPTNDLPKNYPQMTPAQQERALMEAIEQSNMPSMFLVSGRQLAGSKKSIEPPQPLSPTQLCMGIAQELTGQVNPGAVQALLPPPSQDQKKGGVGSDWVAGEKELLSFLTDAFKSIALEQVQSKLVMLRQKAPAVDQSLASAAPQGLYLMLLQANFQKAAGKSDQAIKLYQGIIEKFPKESHGVAEAHRQLIELLFDQKPADLKAIEAHLAALAAAKAYPDEEIKNLGLRLLIKRAQAAEPASRQDVWSEGLNELQPVGIAWSTAALTDLDQLIGQNGQTLQTTEVLANLMIWTPDVPTMHQLQERRIGALIAQGDWTAVRPAVGLDIALANGCKEGPVVTATRIEKQLQQAHAPQAIQTWMQGLIASLTQSPSASLASQEAKAWTDPTLQKMARAVLKSGALSSRRNAYLALFAGDLDRSLQGAVAALDAAPVDAKAVTNALDDIAVVLAVADGSFHRASRFAQWLADRNGRDRATASADHALQVLIVAANGNTTRSSKGFQSLTQDQQLALTQAALRQWGQRAAAWGLNALHAGNAQAAQACWADALNAQRGMGYARLLLDKTFDGATAHCPPDQMEATLAVFDGLAKSLQSQEAVAYLHLRTVTIRRHARLDQINKLYEGGQFEECLAALDELDKSLPEPSGLGDMTTGFMRAMSLIRLERLTEAAQLLGQMHNWPGHDEDHARAVFLIGWIDIQNEKRPEAKAAFTEILKNYPQSSFAPKAKQLIQSME